MAFCGVLTATSVRKSVWMPNQIQKWSDCDVMCVSDTDVFHKIIIIIFSHYIVIYCIWPFLVQNYSACLTSMIVKSDKMQHNCWDCKRFESNQLFYWVPNIKGHRSDIYWGTRIEIASFRLRWKSLIWDEKGGLCWIYLLCLKIFWPFHRTAGFYLSVSDWMLHL